LIVVIPGDHDCQPDDPQDGPVDPNKTPLDGFVQNFMSKDPTKLGSLKTTSSRTQMNLSNIYRTFTTLFATILGLFSHVSETEAELHQHQIDWFNAELTAADKQKALITKDANAVSVDDIMFWNGPSSAAHGPYGYCEPLLYRVPRQETVTI